MHLVTDTITVDGREYPAPRGEVQMRLFANLRVPQRLGEETTLCLDPAGEARMFGDLGAAE